MLIVYKPSTLNILFIHIITILFTASNKIAYSNISKSNIDNSTLLPSISLDLSAFIALVKICIFL